MVSLLNFPYPYKAAIAFSSDVEFMTWEAQLEICRILSKYKIPSAHSLFFFATNFSCHSTFSYFDGISLKPSKYAPLIQDLIKNKFFDTIHAYGDFDGGGFTRKHAEGVYEECLKHDLNFDVFTSHGSDLNSQNVGYVGLDNAPYHGDDPHHEAYHVDITRKIGVRYFWPNSSAILQYPYSGTPIIQLKKSADGEDHLIFYRFRGLPGKAAPNISSFAEQVQIDDIKQLISKERACIYYQHFGVWTKNPDGSFEANRPPYFSKEGFELLEQISDLHQSKDLWIETSGRLLRYIEIRDKLSFSQDGDILEVEANGIADLKPEHFQGLTFKISKLLLKKPPKQIIWRGKSLPFTTFDKLLNIYIQIKLAPQIAFYL